MPEKIGGGHYSTRSFNQVVMVILSISLSSLSALSLLGHHIWTKKPYNNNHRFMAIIQVNLH